MSKARSGGGAKERGAKAGAGDWKQTVSGAVLIVAVLGTLALAAILRGGPEPARSPAAGGPARAVEPGDRDEVTPAQPSAPAPAVDPAPADPLRSTEPPAEAGRPAVQPAANPLDLRADRDRDRLSSRTADWTLQFAKFCEREHVERLLAGLASRDELYVVESGGCYSVCWGVYPSADLARRAANIPPSLAEIPGNPFPKRIEEALK